MHLPILEKLYKTKLGAMFLGLIFDLVIFFLFVVSMTLIYSLMVINIDTKKFEYGILRSIGLNK